jgi:hypothetical protein
VGWVDAGGRVAPSLHWLCQASSLPYPRSPPSTTPNCARTFWWPFVPPRQLKKLQQHQEREMRIKQEEEEKERLEKERIAEEKKKVHAARVNT